MNTKELVKLWEAFNKYVWETNAECSLELFVSGDINIWYADGTSQEFLLVEAAVGWLNEQKEIRE